MADLVEVEAHRNALWRSRRTPIGGRLILNLLKLLGVLTALGVILGLFLLQQDVGPPATRPVESEADNLEIYFTFEKASGAETEFPRLIGGRVGIMKSTHERP